MAILIAGLLTAPISNESGKVSHALIDIHCQSSLSGEIQGSWGKQGLLKRSSSRVEHVVQQYMTHVFDRSVPDRISGMK
jgi:hypothetical protein